LTPNGEPNIYQSIDGGAANEQRTVSLLRLSEVTSHPADWSGRRRIAGKRKLSPQNTREERKLFVSEYAV
jgi:hypothetical protein